MGRTPKRANKGGGTVKTTVELPETLWRAAKVRAMDERTGLRSVIVAALEAYLAPRRREGTR